jgi:ribosomal protein L32
MSPNSCPECGIFSLGGIVCGSCKMTKDLYDPLQATPMPKIELDLNKCPECGGFSLGGIICGSCLLY